MDVAVADGEVVGAEEAGQDADVRGVARGEDERGLPPVEGGDDVLQLAEPPARPREERGARRPAAGLVERPVGGGDDARVEVEAEVAVRVEADEPLRPRGERVADDDLVVERPEELEPVLRRVVALGAERVEHRGEVAAAGEEVVRPPLPETRDRRRDGGGVGKGLAHLGPPGPVLDPPGHPGRSKGRAGTEGGRGPVGRSLAPRDLRDRRPPGVASGRRRALAFR